MGLNYGKMDFDGRIELTEGVHEVTLESVNIIEDKDNREVLVFDFFQFNEAGDKAYMAHRTILTGKDEKQLNEQVFPRIGMVLNHLSGTDRGAIEKMFVAAEADDFANWAVLVKHINKYLSSIKEDKKLNLLVTSSWSKGIKYLGVPPFGRVTDKVGGKALVFDPERHIGKEKKEEEAPATTGHKTADPNAAKKVGL
jgi:hypothetical protein